MISILAKIRSPHRFLSKCSIGTPFLKCEAVDSNQRNDGPCSHPCIVTNCDPLLSYKLHTVQHETMSKCQSISRKIRLQRRFIRIRPPKIQISKVPYLVVLGVDYSKRKICITSASPVTLIILNNIYPKVSWKSSRGTEEE